MDGKTIIYLLIGIAWFAFNIYSQSQKKKKQALKNNSSDSDNNNYSEDIHDEYNKAINEIFKNQNVKTEPAFQSSNIDSIEYDKQKPEQSIKQNIKATTKNKPAKNYNIPEEEENPNEILEDFDIKKAVLYSEILKRPEF